MADDFDPYLKWLGIRDPQRPPNHYRLLGIDPLEADPDIIEMAVDRQMPYVRGLLSGPQGEIAQRIVDELTAAKHCLLNKEKKAAYDAELTAKLPKVRAVAKPLTSTAPTMPAGKSAIGSAASPKSASTSADTPSLATIKPVKGTPANATTTTTSKPDKGRRKQDNSKLMIMAGAAVGLVVVVAIIFVATSGGSPEKTTSQDRTSEDKTNNTTVAQNDPSKKKTTKQTPDKPPTDSPNTTTKKPEPKFEPPVKPVEPPVQPVDPSLKPKDPAPTTTSPPIDSPPIQPVAMEPVTIGKPIDLLAKIDIERDVVAGTWRKKDGALEVAPLHASRIMLPEILIPRDYVMSMRVRRSPDENMCKVFGIGFVMDGLPGVMILNCFERNGLHVLDGRHWNNNESTTSGDLFQDDQDHKVELTVHPGFVELSVDGQKKVTWQGDASRLAAEVGWSIREPLRLSLSSSVAHVIRDVQLRVLPAMKWPFANSPYSLTDRKLPEAEMGGWTREGKTLVSPADKDTRLVLSDKAPLEFRWNLEADVDEGQGTLTAGFPYLGRQLAYVVDLRRPVAGLDGFDGKPFGANPSTRKIEGSKRLQVEIAVVGRQLSISVNGKPTFQERLVPETWSPLKITKLESADGVKFKTLEDGSHLVLSTTAIADSYFVEATSDLDRIEALRLDVFPDPSLPNHGPGCAQGNFVLSQLLVEAASTTNAYKPVKFTSAIADHHQENFYPTRSIIGEDPKSGWGIAWQPGKQHSMVVISEQPFGDRAGNRLKIRMEQNWGEQHVIGRFRWSASPTKQAALFSVHAPARLTDPLDARWKLDKQPQFFLATSGLAAKVDRAELSTGVSGSGSGPSSKDPRPEIVQTGSGIAPPGDEDLEKARKLVRTTFANELAKIKKNPEGRGELARQLLVHARKSKANLVEYYALLDEARTMAIEAGNYPAAAEATDELANTFDVNGSKLKVSTLIETSKKAKLPADCEAAGRAALELCEQLADVNQLEAIDSLLKAAQSLAQRGKDADLTAAVKERVAQAAEEKKRWQTLELFRTTIKEMPDDPEANLAIGKYLCLLRDNWTEGLPMLGKGSDEELKALAALETEKPSDSLKQLKLADAWRAYSEKQSRATTADKIGSMNRAVHWYSTALPQLTGLEKVKADSALDQLQTAVSKLTRVPRSLEIKLADRVSLKMKLIPAGKFVMGDRRFSPPHPVQISKPFYIGIYELTNAQWNSLMPNIAAENADLPRSQLSWDDCQLVIAKLNQLPTARAYRFRMPTEAEWEYACRAGTTTRNYWGDDDRLADEHCWYGTNSGNKLHPVGQKRPNPWGLYDMIGNGHEWCADRYDDTYFSRSPLVDPKGPETGEHRTARGVSVFQSYVIEHVSSTFRQAFDPGGRAFDTCFRIVAERK